MIFEQSNKKPIKNIYIFLITTIAILLVVWGSSTVITTIKNQQKIIALQEILLSHIDDIKLMDLKSQEVFDDIAYLKTISNALKKNYLVGMFMIAGGFSLSFLAETWTRKARIVRTE